MQNTVFIDWFGVVCNKAFWEWAKDNSPDDQTFEQLLEIADQVDAGVITLNQFRQNSGRLAGKTADEFRQEFTDRISINQPVIEFVQRIKTDYPIIVLSNVNAEFLTEFIQQKNLGHIFDRVIASSTHKMVKPNPKFFGKAMHIAGCERAVLIDDTPGHVKSFIKYGQQGIVFTGPVSQLELDFQEIRGQGF